jgi:hypothetical protein
LQAIIFFMPKGHNFNLLDQTICPLINKLKGTQICTPSELSKFIFSAMLGSGYAMRGVLPLHHVWDLRSWLADYLNAISGYATSGQSDGMYEMHISLDRDGDVRVRFRQSPQSSTWLPEGPEERGFYTRPVGEAPAAPAREDGLWGKHEVLGTVRAWLRSLLGGAELLAAEREWQKVFDELPPDGDTNALPAGKKLTWPILPRAQHVVHPSAVASADIASGDMVENPDVNPIAGCHRRSSVVRQELLL